MNVLIITFFNPFNTCVTLYLGSPMFNISESWAHLRSSELQVLVLFYFVLEFSFDSGCIRSVPYKVQLLATAVFRGKRT